jgi:GNAT superfamily N-acetyltransferase
MSDLRKLAAGDLTDLENLSRQANWNQTAQDWLRVLELCPEGCIGIERDGRIVSSTTVTCYGPDLAWIGMVLTDPAHRGRGYAARLMREALDWLRARGVACIKLDATAMGQPIYARLGFQDECPIERWRRPASAFARPGAPAVFPPGFDAALDLEAFGVSRRELLESLVRIESAHIEGEAYAMGRQGALAWYFGPCVAHSEAAARSLLEWCLLRHGSEDMFWDLLPSNASAVRLATGYGFAPVRSLVRMALRAKPGAAPPATHNAAVYAIAGFEYG